LPLFLINITPSLSRIGLSRAKGRLSAQMEQELLFCGKAQGED